MSAIGSAGVDDVRSGRERRPRVLLVDMPFSAVSRPSLALGLLKAIGCRAGYQVEVLPLKLHYAVHFAELRAYTVAANGFNLGYGEWVFSGAAFGEFSPRNTHEATYEDFLRSRGVPEEIIRDMRILRGTVAGFLQYSETVVDWKQYDLVGFTTTCSELTPALALAQRVKAWSPRTRILLGGAKCEGEMGAGILSAFEQVDFVFDGEAEASFLEVLEDVALDGRKPVAGVHRRDVEARQTAVSRQGPTDLNTLPAPDYSDYFEVLRALKAQDLIPQVITLEGSRGCWWGEKSLCTFCGLNGRMISYRRKDPERLVQEVVELVDRHRVFKISLSDNIIDPDYMHTFFPRLTELDLSLDIFLEIKSNMKLSQLETLLAAGVRSFQPGIENLDSHILKLMHKGVSGLQNVQLLKSGAELGIKMLWNLLFNFPGETDADYENVLRLLEFITHLQPPECCGQIRVDRFSPNFRDAVAGSEEWWADESDEFPGAELKAFREDDPALMPRIKLTGPLEFYRHTFDLDEAHLRRIAYSFEYRLEGSHPAPEFYERVVEFVSEWQRRFVPQQLVYFKGRRCLRIEDRRFNLSARTITLAEREKEIYLACGEITTPEHLTRILAKKKPLSAPRVDEVREFLDKLVGERLVLREGNRYLALAVPWDQVQANYREFRNKSWSALGPRALHSQRRRRQEEAPQK